MLYKQFSDLSHSQKLRRLRQIALEALSHYDLRVGSIRFYAEHSNALFSVDTAKGERYLLKVARPGDHSMEEIRSSLWWLRDANLAGIPNLMEVVPTRDDRLAVEARTNSVPDPRYCSLYRWIPGRNLQGRVTGPAARKWGELMARLHRFSDDYRARPETDLMTWNKVYYWDEEVLFSSEYAGLVTKARQTVFRRATDEIQSRMDRLYASGQSPILIHADLHPDNIKVNNGELWAIDVEDVMWGFPLQDIAIALLYVRRRPEFPRLLENFGEGYSSIRAWPVSDPGDLATYFTARILMFANFIVKLPDFDADVGETLDRYVESCREYLGS